MPEKDCRLNCPFKLLSKLFEALPSGRCVISWHNKELTHYEKVESEAKVNLND